VFTDPSYLGQIVVMTAPMIGNYGINPEDVESDRPRVAGVVVRELAATPSNWRSTGTLIDWLAGAKVPLRLRRRYAAAHAAHPLQGRDARCAGARREAQ